VFAAVLTFFLTLGYRSKYVSLAQLSTGFTITNPFDEERYNVFEEKVKFSNLIATINSPVVLSMVSYHLILHDLEEDPAFRQVDSEEEINVLNKISFQKAQETFRAKLANSEVLSTYNDGDRQLLELLEIYGYDQRSLRDELQSYREGLTDYITVRFSSENPQLSAFVVNTLCDEFIRYYNSLQLTRTNESATAYKKLLEQKQQVLEVKSNALEQFKSSQGVLNFNVESESKVEQIAEAEGALVEERTKANGLRMSLTSASQQLETLEAQMNQSEYSSADLGTNADVLQLQQRIKEVNRAYVTSGMTDQNLMDSLTRLRKLRTSLLRASSGGNQMPLADVRERLVNLREKKNQLEVDLAISLENIEYIRSTLGVLRSNVGTYASKEARIAALQREVELATQEYQDAQEKYSAALDMSLSSISNVRQTVYGQPAIEPEPSKRLILTGLVGISTFVLGALLIGLISYVDVTLKDSFNFTRTVNLRLIGVVNRVALGKTSISRIFSNMITSTNRADDTDSTFKELVRKIRFEIDSTGKKTFLFTSPKAQEGKSILMISLAYTFSMSKKRVLLVDTNFPHNTLTKYFKATPALEEFIEKQGVESGASKGVITRTGIPSVDIIGCAGGSFSPLERFSSEDVKRFIDYMSQYYDYILLEGPSLNRFLDSKELSLFVDRVIAVFSAKTVIRHSDRETIAFLKNLDDKFLGAVLTQVEREDVDA
jgi:Mrp family chromosome partitioning ATPase/uncharacterized protein involved in exopolysaccharide biosynthesis